MLAIVAGGCATNVGDLGMAVTEHGGVQELIVDLCGADPPERLIVARSPTGGVQDPKRDGFSPPEDELVLFDLTASEWESDRRTFALGEISDAPPPMRGFMLFTESDDATGRSSSMQRLPAAPWPAHPHALTSPFSFDRPVRLDTERGDLCERK